MYIERHAPDLPIPVNSTLAMVCIGVYIVPIWRPASHGETARPPGISESTMSALKKPLMCFMTRGASFFDEEHSENQGRYSVIGFSNKARLLFVS